MLKRFVNDASAASAIEYGLIAALVALGIVGGLTNFSDAFNNLFANNAGRFQQSINSIN